MKLRNIPYKYLAAGAALLFMVSCAQEETALMQTADEDAVPVSVSIGLAPDQFLTDSGYEPMSRGGDSEILTQISNKYHYLIMKDIDGDLVVERSATGFFIPSQEEGKGTSVDAEVLDITGTNGLPDNPLEVDLTPGDYTMLIVLNGDVGRIIPFTKGEIIRKAGGNSELPMFMTYVTLGQGCGSDGSELSLKRDVFSDLLKFSVNKTTGLSSAGTGVELQANTERRTCAFYVILKYANPKYAFNSSSQYCGGTISTTDGNLFPCGIDVFGKPYYAEETPDMQLTSFKIAYSFTTAYHRLDNSSDRFKLPGSGWQSNSWVSGYYFSDPEKDVPFIMQDWTARNGSEGRRYELDGTINRVFRHNQYDTIAFEPYGNENKRPVHSGGGMTYQRWVSMRVIENGRGQAINALPLYTPEVFWNGPLQ